MGTKLAISTAPTIIANWNRRVATQWERAPAGVRDNARLLAGLALLLGVWRMAILALSLIWSRVGVRFPWPDEYAGMRLWRFSIRWDAEWYLQIAQHGYTHTDGAQSSVAFFPGFPLAIRLFDALLPGGGAFAGLAVVHLALIAALVYVYLLARLDFSDRVAWWTIGFMLMFPAAFYYSAIYPQSLLLLGIAGALYHARRGQWWFAGTFGFLAGATSLAGLVVVIPLGIELRRWGARHQIRPQDVVAVALSPLGGIAYFAYLWSEFGSPRVIMDSLKAWDAGTSSALLWSRLEYLRWNPVPMVLIGGRQLGLRDDFVALELTLICAFLSAGAYLCWKVRPSYGVLVIGMTLVPMLVGTRLGIGGHVAVLFPAFILLARIAHDGMRMTLSIIFTLGLTLTTFLFVHGFWAG
ncbi:MAG TPA: mannosyltransferase family protein [Thermomicrobiales bacterium]|nr:mannosyltransferase family protein [Thermomicrobiales bacterium]